MASLFGHAAAALALSSTFSFEKKERTKVILLAVVSSILPDVDILAFRFGIPYEHILGHRGFTHSIGFALIWSLLMKGTFFSSLGWKSKKSLSIIFLIFLSTLSHALLDALTTGGRGVAIFWPFDSERYFFPDAWRVIRVSPISPSRFFSSRGLQVLQSEAIWIGIPAMLIVLGSIIRKRSSRAA